MKTTSASPLRRPVLIFTVLSLWMSNVNATESATGLLSGSAEETKTSNNRPQATLPSVIPALPLVEETLASKGKLKLHREELSRGGLRVSSLTKKSLLESKNMAVDAIDIASSEEEHQFWKRILQQDFSFPPTPNPTKAPITPPPATLSPVRPTSLVLNTRQSKKPKAPTKSSKIVAPQLEILIQGRTLWCYDRDVF